MKANQIAEVPEWLSTFQELKHISIDATEVTDLVILSKLPNLESLKIECLHSQIKDFSSLTSLRKLSFLELSGVVESDLSVLSCLPKLTSLTLSCESTKAIKLPQQIEYLFLGARSQAQIESVAQLIQLKELHITGGGGELIA